MKTLCLLSTLALQLSGTLARYETTFPVSSHAAYIDVNEDQDRAHSGARLIGVNGDGLPDHVRNFHKLIDGRHYDENVVRINNVSPSLAFITSLRASCG
jgi:hypothetical protein